MKLRRKVGIKCQGWRCRTLKAESVGSPSKSEGGNKVSLIARYEEDAVSLFDKNPI
jgi:hypothetical protein